MCGYVEKEQPRCVLHQNQAGVETELLGSVIIDNRKCNNSRLHRNTKRYFLATD